MGGFLVGLFCILLGSNAYAKINCNRICYERGESSPLCIHCGKSPPNPLRKPAFQSQPKAKDVGVGSPQSSQGRKLTCQEICERIPELLCEEAGKKCKYDKEWIDTRCKSKCKQAQ